MLAIRRIVFILLFLFIISCSKTKNKEFDLVFLATTDIHGSFFPFDSIRNEEVDHSLAHASYVLDELRKTKNTEVVYIDSGDYLQGDPVVDYFNQNTNGINTASCVINYISPLSMTIGNHDIERGPEVYDKVHKELTFPWLAANVIDRETKKTYFTPYTVTNIQGLKIVVLGMLTPTTSHLPEYLWDKVEFEDILESSKKWVSIIKEKENPDLLIGSFHSGLGSGKKYKPMTGHASLYTALNVEGFDIIFKGHDHVTHLTNVKSPSGKDVIILGGENAVKTIAQVTIPVNKVNGKLVLQKPKPEIIIFQDKNKPFDTNFTQQFKKQFDEATNYLAQPVGNLSKPISSKKSLFGPSEFIDTLHKVQFDIASNKLKVPAELSIIAPTTLIDIPTNVVVRNLYGMYYYDNWPMIYSLKGHEVKSILEKFLRGWFNTMKNSDDYLLAYNRFNKQGKLMIDTRNGGFQLQKPYIYFNNFAGINFTVDLQKRSNRVYIETLCNGHLFDMNETYNVIANTFLRNTIQTVLKLSDEEIEQRILASSRTNIRIYLQNYIKDSGTVDVPLYNNWVLNPTNWTKMAREREYKLWFTNSNFKVSGVTPNVQEELISLSL